MKRYKVLVDTSVLISGSVASLIKDVKIKHHFYELTHPLFKFFKENIPKRIGLTTEQIEISASNNITKAITSELDELSKKNKKINLGFLFNSFSFILSESIRNLEENKNLLTREPIDKEELNKYATGILLFYRSDLIKKLKENDPIKVSKLKISFVPRIFKKVAKESYIRSQKEEFPFYPNLKSKLIDNPPNKNDEEILAQAIYLKDLMSRECDKFFITSTDHHFVKIRKGDLENPFIPDGIRKKFGIACLWPDEMLKILQTNK